MGSGLGGSTVTAVAGRDLTVHGSNVVSDTGTTLVAGNNLAITAATHTASQSDFKEEKKSGLMGSGGIGITVGKKQLSTDGQDHSSTASGSTVAALSGGVTLVAGIQHRQTGSQVLATGADGNVAAANIAIQAKSVAITEARDSSTSSMTTKQSSSGLTVTVSNPVVSVLQSSAGTAQSMACAAKATGGDARMQALAAASVALNGYSTANELAALAKDPSKATSVGVSVSIGTSKSQSTDSASSNSAVGSTVKALGNVNINATGAGKDSNLLIQGSDIRAGLTTTLQADNAIQLLAAQSTSEQHSSQSGKSGSIGVSVGGVNGVTLSGSKSKGQGDGQDSTYTNTHVSAGNTVSLTSGGDTTLAGATVAANTVQTTVGGDLAITSLQDQSRYDAQSKSVGGSITIGPGGVPTGGSLSAGNTDIHSNYQSVAEQSAIVAGDGGFQVNVKGNTTLTGGAITSTQAAVDQAKNSFTTGGTLTTTDIQNTSSYNASGYSVSASVGTDAKGKVTPGGSAGFGKDAGDATSVTTAGISGIAADKTLRTGDKQTGIQAIFDKDKVTTEVNAQIAITAEFGKQASKAIGDQADIQKNQALQNAARARANGDEAQAQQLDAEAAKWAEGGIYRIAAHAVVGGWTGGVNGALGSTASAAAAPALNDLQDGLQTKLQQAGLSDTAAKAIAQLAGTATATAAGAAVGGTAGAAAAFNGDLNNRQLHPTDKQLAAKLAAKGKYSQAQIEEQMRLMGNAAYGELPNTTAVLTNSQAIQNNISQDPGMPKAVDNRVVVEIPGQANQEIQLYILANSQDDAGISVYSASNGALKRPAYSNTPSATNANTRNCATAECAAGLLRVANDNRTVSQIDASVDRTITEIALTPAVLATGAALAPTTLLGATATGGAIAGSNNLAVQIITTGKIDAKEALVNTAAGAALGAVGYGVAAGISNALGEAATAAEQKAIDAARVENNIRADDAQQYINRQAPINVPQTVVRSDNDFTATVNAKGNLKAFTDADGNLVPANPAGTGSLQTHVRGGNSENSPLISTSDPTLANAPKDYGLNQITINTRDLQRDMNAGSTPQTTEIISPQSVQAELQLKLDSAQARFDKNPSRNNKESLTRAQNDIANTVRDGECLIKGCVPAPYIVWPNGVPQIPRKP